MRYGVWSGEKERFPRAFYERAYHRQSLAAWDDKWHRLSDQARNFFLNVVKGPAKPPAHEFDQLSVPSDKFPPHILEELTAAGFVEVQRARSQASTDRVIAVPCSTTSPRAFALATGTPAGRRPAERVSKYVE